MEEQEPARERRARRITDEEDQEPDAEMSPEEEHRAVEEANERTAEDHRRAMEADEPRPGDLPNFPVDPVKGLNAGEPDR